MTQKIVSPKRLKLEKIVTLSFEDLRYITIENQMQTFKCNILLTNRKKLNFQLRMVLFSMDSIDSIYFSELAVSIRESYPDLYKKRRTTEKSTNVYEMPLPWRPGWRNLVSGRALGGNPLG